MLFPFLPYAFSLVNGTDRAREFSAYYKKSLRGSMLHIAHLINPRSASNKPICSIYKYFKAYAIVPRSELSEKLHTGGAHPITESFYLPPAEHRLARDPYHHLQ